jgi:tetratricopeptide (TPR) repeat protein
MRWNLRMRWKLALDHFWDALSALGEPRPRTRLGLLFVVLGGVFRYFLGRAKPRDADPQRLELILRTYAQMVESYMMLNSPALLLAFRASALARQAPASAGRIAAEGPLALCFAVLGRYRTAKRLAGESLETATRIDAPYERACALATIGTAHYAEGNYALALERLNEARVQMMEYGFSHRISQVYSIYLRILLEQGEFRRFTALMSEVQQIAQRTESSCVHMYIGGGVLARVSCGEYQKAERDRADAECQMERADPELTMYYRQSLVFWLGTADLSAGRIDEAIGELREAVELQRQVKLPLPIAEHFDYYMSLALFAKLRRDGVLPRSEKKELARAVAGCRKVAKIGVPYRLQALVVSAAHDAWRRERVRAEQQLEQLAALSEPCGTSALVASAELEVGSALLRTAQDEREGRRLVERALLAFERMGGHGLSDRAREVLAAQDSVAPAIRATLQS